MTQPPFCRFVAAVAAPLLGLAGPAPAFALRAGLEGTTESEVARTLGVLAPTHVAAGMEENQVAARVEAAEMIRRALDEAPAWAERQVVAISPNVLSELGYEDLTAFLQSVPALSGRVLILPAVAPRDPAHVVREKVDGFFSALPADATVMLYARPDELSAASVVARFDLRTPFQFSPSYRFVDPQALTARLEELLNQILRDVGVPDAGLEELTPKILTAIGLGQAA